MAERIQLRRTTGWRKPDRAIVVARPTRWGNPFPVKGDWIMWTAVALGYTGDLSGRRLAAVALHRAWLTGDRIELGPLAGDRCGGTLEFSDGAEVLFSDHVRRIAGVAAALMGEPPVLGSPPSLEDLAGHDLACWCPPGPCHADVLLELANTAAA